MALVENTFRCIFMRISRSLKLYNVKKPYAVEINWGKFLLGKGKLTWPFSAQHQRISTPCLISTPPRLMALGGSRNPHTFSGKRLSWFTWTLFCLTKCHSKMSLQSTSFCVTKCCSANILLTKCYYAGFCLTKCYSASIYLTKCHLKCLFHKMPTLQVSGC